MLAGIPLPVTDLRTLLPCRSWSIGRRAATTSITVHYNGPAVDPDRQAGPALLAQLAADTAWQMRPGWGGTKDGAPHLMYHIVIDALGTVYQTADLDEELWHCAHQDGNSHGLAVHFPIGGSQDVTPAQWAAGVCVLDALRVQYGIARNRVVGHLEWKHATACPGTHLMQRVLAYRGGAVATPPPAVVAPAGLRRFEIICEDKANVRQGPATTFPVAGTLKSGTEVWVDVIKTDGESIDGDRRWAHMARVANHQADLGFISMTLLKEVMA